MRIVSDYSKLGCKNTISSFKDFWYFFSRSNHFKKKVTRLINVMKMTTSNKIVPDDETIIEAQNEAEDDDDIEVVIASKLKNFM